MPVVKFNAEIPALKEFGCDQRGARAAERIEDHIAGLAETSDQGFENGNGLLRRMEAIAGIFPIHHDQTMGWPGLGLRLSSANTPVHDDVQDSGSMRHRAFEIRRVQRS